MSIWKDNGLVENKPHLERQELTIKMHKILMTYGMIVLNTSAGTGKTSLLQMYKSQLEGSQEYHVDYKIMNSKPEDIFRFFREEIGLDVEAMKAVGSLKSALDAGKVAVLMIDDAHQLWPLKTTTPRNARYSDFWLNLLKGYHTVHNLKIIVAATRSLRISGESPADLAEEKCLLFEDFKLSDEESHGLLDISATILEEPNSVDGHPQLAALLRSNNIIRTLLTTQCAGIVSALCKCVNYLAELFKHDKDASRISAENVIRAVLSKKILDRVFKRCFPIPDRDDQGGLTTISAPLREILLKCTLEGSFDEDELKTEDDQQAVNKLVKYGILVIDSVRNISFSAMIAQRCISDLLFPHRGSTVLPDTVTAREVVLMALQALSATDLTNAVAPGSNELPCEGVWQQSMYSALLRITSSGCAITPELSTVYPSLEPLKNPDGNRVRNDFWINGKLNIAIELLISHRGRCGHNEQYGPRGRYRDLNPRDNIVVDICKTKKAPGVVNPKYKSTNSMTVFFEEGSYTHCFIHEGMNEDVHRINLAM